MATTTNLALPYPGVNDAPNGPSQIAALAQALDTLLGGAWSTYTPAWTCDTGTNPSIGNGSIAGRYRQVGRHVTVNIRLTMGSTTTYGTGPWRLSLPVDAVDSGVGACVFYDSSTAGNRKPGACWTASSTLLRLNGDTGDLNATNPFTWATDDQLRLTFIYESSS